MPPATRPGRTKSVFDMDAVALVLAREAAQLPRPIVTELAAGQAAPFKILVSTIISLRTKDAVTAAASTRVFALAETPDHLLTVPLPELEQAIYPAGFYKSKAATLREIARRLVDEFGGAVPRELETLLSFKGIGRKTANLVLTLGHGLPGICVDTHVHRITNRWGYVRTRTPDETEFALRKKLPAPYWIPINDWLVAWGQFVCLPISPWCSRCPLTPWCARRDVARSR